MLPKTAKRESISIRKENILGQPDGSIYFVSICCIYAVLIYKG